MPAHTTTLPAADAMMKAALDMLCAATILYCVVYCIVVGIIEYKLYQWYKHNHMGCTVYKEYE